MAANIGKCPLAAPNTKEFETSDADVVRHDSRYFYRIAKSGGGGSGSKYKCPKCGYESDSAGTCPYCYE